MIGCLHGLSHKIISLWKKHPSIYYVYFYEDFYFEFILFNNTSFLSVHYNYSFLCHLELAKVGRSQISLCSLKCAVSFSFSDNGHCVSLEIFLGAYYSSATSVGKLKAWKQISLDGSPSCQNEPSIHYWIIHLLHLDLQPHFSSKLLSRVLGILFFCHFWTKLLHSTSFTTTQQSYFPIIWKQWTHNASLEGRAGHRFLVEDIKIIFFSHIIPLWITWGRGLDHFVRQEIPGRKTDSYTGVIKIVLLALLWNDLEMR